MAEREVYDVETASGRFAFAIGLVRVRRARARRMLHVTFTGLADDPIGQFNTGREFPDRGTGDS